MQYYTWEKKTNQQVEIAFHDSVAGRYMSGSYGDPRQAMDAIRGCESQANRIRGRMDRERLNTG